MFVQVLMKDKVRVDPQKFAMDYEEAMEQFINEKYSQKIIPDVGLCISLYDFVEVGEPFIYSGDGASYTDVTFRLIVFRPNIGDVITGIITESNDQIGLRVSLDFFTDVYIPHPQLPQPRLYDEETKTWYWECQGMPFPMEVGQKIRFKVFSVHFRDPTTITAAPKLEKKTPQQSAEPKKEEEPLLVIYGRCNEPGLGCIRWWDYYKEPVAEEETQVDVTQTNGDTNGDKEMTEQIEIVET